METYPSEVISFCKSFELRVFSVRSSMTFSGGGMIASTKGDESTMVLSNVFENFMITALLQRLTKEQTEGPSTVQFAGATISLSTTTINSPPPSVITRATSLLLQHSTSR